MSLIELIVSLTVLSIALLGIATVFPLGSQTVSRAGGQTTAVELAQQGVESLMQLQYGDPLLEVGVTHQDSVQVGGVLYRKRWVVTADYPISNCKLVTYRVSWPTASGRDQVEVKAVLARAGRD